MPTLASLDGKISRKKSVTAAFIGKLSSTGKGRTTPVAQTFNRSPPKEKLSKAQLRTLKVTQQTILSDVTEFFLTQASRGVLSQFKAHVTAASAHPNAKEAHCPFLKSPSPIAVVQSDTCKISNSPSLSRLPSYASSRKFQVAEKSDNACHSSPLSLKSPFETPTSFSSTRKCALPETAIPEGDEEAKTAPFSACKPSATNRNCRMCHTKTQTKLSIRATSTKKLESSNKLCAITCLKKAIDAHQKDDMTNSARWFECSAKKGGGCGVGMLMWALSLRHGWGCKVDLVKAFYWLQLAAETLLKELKQFSVEEECSSNAPMTEGQHALLQSSILTERGGIIRELSLALYEIGQCFMQGWGSEKDKAVSVEYFKVAATLGDPDAQNELAYCYETGRGVKKNFQNAATYYRMAFAHGASIMGYQWIWKDKYSLCQT